MKYELAESILKSTMGHWDLGKMAIETRDIQNISEIKYDDYQQFTHGMRYVESLALWMRQFKDANDKELAYQLIKEKLIYVSEEEMRQLIAYSYKMSMRQYLLNKTKDFCKGNSIMEIKERKKIFNYYLRSSLFLGLSDGAHIDFFRRQNPQLSNEQVFVHYDFSEDKLKDMCEKLQEEPLILEIQNKYCKIEKGFSSFFLIDDFTGSGKSYIRKDDRGWHGKIHKFIMRLTEMNYDIKDAAIHVLLYIATDKSLNYINDQVKLYCSEKSINSITLDAIQKVNPINWDDENKMLLDLLKRNYNELSKTYKSYNDKHFQVGEGQQPFIGFADCSLPLILYHNTPNNSLPILWYSWDDNVNALFPRITRHKEG